MENINVDLYLVDKYNTLKKVIKLLKKEASFNKYEHELCHIGTNKNNKSIGSLTIKNIAINSLIQLGIRLSMFDFCWFRVQKFSLYEDIFFHNGLEVLLTKKTVDIILNYYELMLKRTKHINIVIEKLDEKRLFIKYLDEKRLFMPELFFSLGYGSVSYIKKYG